MTPHGLVDLCTAAVDAWNDGGRTDPPPSVLLVVPRARCPSGDTVALFGRGGPRGRIATIRETPGGYEVVAYFPAAAVLDAIARVLRQMTP